MVERCILTVTCQSCNHEFKPYGNQMKTLPQKRSLKCPSCQNTYDYTWLDSGTRRKKIERDLGLLNSNDNPQVKNKVEILEKEIEILKQKTDIILSKIDSVKDWANIREKDFVDIEKYAEQEREREKMEQDGT